MSRQIDWHKPCQLNPHFDSFQPVFHPLMTMPNSQEVADYLKQHPAFFAERLDLLAELDLPTPAGATPFHQRQARALRERQNSQQASMDSLLNAAKSNQNLADELHQLAVDLLTLQGIDSADSSTPPAPPELWVKRRFGIDEAVVFPAARQADLAPGIDYALLRRRVAHGGSVCDDRISKKLNAALFPHAKAIASCAFVPLVHQHNLHGVMALGSVDKQRFRPEMGVLILDRLGQLIGAYLVAQASAEPDSTTPNSA